VAHELKPHPFDKFRVVVTANVLRRSVFI